ncbi:Maf family protein [Pseudarthrobacter sp. MM222]|uniref:Maf family protein n=1 Tax=Pseudarthrobacter sp. MM222 TaxID=3018929 RepID=UPI002220FADC|nr:nucleoside triphosphate pyrophosphatase [Pseudarthrobacter sp. MM222]CAI3795017.1 Nucleoside triphosphate pyrophosphatase [Pseudarthrobacter sp. MM222]
MTRLILASQSPARTKLLSYAGIRHEVLVSDVDEDAVQARYGVTDPHDTALLLARAKAEAVASLPEAEGALVLGCDSVFEFDGEAHGKPYTAEVARERMLRMSGSMGVLHTGHWLVDCRDTDGPADSDSGPDTENPDDTPERPGTGATLGHVTSAEVHFMEMSAEEIDAYIATGEPLQCAGSFTIDGYGGAFIRKVDGDPHTVVGLSISTLRGLLGQAKVGITELWTEGAVDPAEVRAE